jgi:hypothetical protein
MIWVTETHDYNLYVHAIWEKLAFIWEKSVWKCDYGYFLKCFLCQNALK